MISGARIGEVDAPLPAVSVREAIGDLPRQTEHLAGKVPEERHLSPSRSPSPRAAVLHDWPGRPSPSVLTGNWYRSTPRDYGIFRDMAHGDVYPHAVAIAHRHAWQATVSEMSRGLKTDSEEIRARHIPPYRLDAFDEKWAKLMPDQPAWTVTAHLSKDGYSHIHYDSTQARTISIREAARLQSFPDAIEFQGNFGEQLRQIGNAVPPLLARALATTVIAQLAELRPGPPRSSQRAHG